jgi:hypothetical protein
LPPLEPEVGMRLRDYDCRLDALVDRGAGRPPAVLSSETSTSSASPVLRAMEQGRGDAAGDVHAADRVAERRHALGERARSSAGDME